MMKQLLRTAELPVVRRGSKPFSNFEVQKKSGKRLFSMTTEESKNTNSIVGDPCIPVPLSTKQLSEIVPNTKDWLLIHGAGMRLRGKYDQSSLYHVPFLLIPSTIPREHFEACISIQEAMNELTHKVAYDDEFLRSSLKYTIQVDDFTKKLFEVYDVIKREGIKQDISLGMLRSDYFIDEPKSSVKQIEMNTVATSFGNLSSVLYKCHRYVLRDLGYEEHADRVVENRTLNRLAEGMCEGLSHYEKKCQPSTGILFVVEDTTYNICDQRLLEYKILSINSKVRIIRKTLTQIREVASLQDDRLFIDGTEIGIVYFRAGYSPDHYPSNKEWEARLFLERSRAIKCPSIQYHLAGTKKIQQELSQPEVLERFITDKQKLRKLRETFAGLYPLDTEEQCQYVVSRVIEEPEKYILKPQREGGGHNIYGSQVKDKLLALVKTDERKAWIVMDKLHPPVHKNYMVRPDQPEPIFSEFVSELGIFGMIIGNSKEIFYNQQVGHILRTKMSTSDEGGIAAGFGALDSVYIPN